MDTVTPTLAAEAEALRAAFAELNRGDPSALAELLDPDIEWIEPDHYHQGSGTFHGAAAVVAMITEARSKWAEGACEPERFIPAGDKLVMLVHVHVRQKGRAEWIDARLADVYTFRDGKAIQMRHFPDRRDALKYAGVTGSDAA